ncbi:competence type IV pilus assembly protein ComGB [Alteribacillus sp. HJP-4]|uniref:competence type IV pilus assembly protein ComGB n=1 Tax=Alteribacillus sp. HJP-4 TaxID=2775394 RepID=UPI0035CCECD1
MHKPWKKEEKAEFLKKTGLLLEEGYSLDQTIELLSWEQTDSVKQQLQEMLADLRNGYSFHDVLNYLFFPADVTAYIFFAEESGFLSKGLIGAGELYKKRIEASRKVKQLLRYPLLLLWLLFCLGIILFQYMFPSFKQLFDSMDMELPLYTRIVMGAISFSPIYVVAVFTGAALLLVYYFKIFRHITPHRQMEQIYRIPFLSSSARLFLSHYLALQLSIMMKGGLSIYQSCDVLERQNHFMFLHEEGKKLKQHLKEGTALYEAVGMAPWYRKELKFVIKHGQETGFTEEHLYQYSIRAADLLEEKVNKSVALVQPIMFTFVGFIVLSLFLSVFLPMFSLMTSL